MSVNGNGPDGNGHTSTTPAGVVIDTNPYRSGNSPKKQTADDFFAEDVVVDGVEADAPPTEPPDEKRVKRRRKKIIAGLMIVMLIAGVGMIAYLRLTRKTRVDYRVQDGRERATATQSAQTSSSPDNTTRQAIEDAQRSIVSTPPGMAEPNGTNGSASVAPPPTVTTVPASPLIVPENVAGTVLTTPTSGRIEDATSTGTASGKEAETTTTTRSGSGTTTRTSGRTTNGIQSRRNTERSIFMVEAEPSPATASTRTPLSSSQREVDRGRTAAREEQQTVVKPPFGTMLPVRTLGAIYTLRSGSLVRMELTRDVSGDGWAIRRGTVLVGALRGSEYDRAYLSLIGFLDPAAGRLVKVGGDVLGADGGAGLKGKRRRIDSRWARVFRQVANGALGITQSALAGRNGGTTIIMPNVQGAFSPELYALTRGGNRREFVEVTAGSSGYVMVTDFPREIKGIDSLVQMDGVELARYLVGA